MNIAIVFPPYTMSIAKRGCASIHIGHIISILEKECSANSVRYIDYNQSLFYIYSHAVSEICDSKISFPIHLLYQEKLQLINRMVIEEILQLSAEEKTNRLFRFNQELIDKLTRLFCLAMESIISHIFASPCDAIFLFVSPEISYALGLCASIRKHNPDVPLFIFDNYTFEPATPYFTAPITGRDIFDRSIQAILDCDPLTSVLKQRIPSWIDWIIIGEGYDAVRTLFKSHVKTNRIEGVSFFSDGTFSQGLISVDSPFRRINGVRILHSNPIELDSLPFPSFDSMEHLFKSAELEITRGCSYNCIFCERTGLFGDTLRSHSVEYMEQLINYLQRYDFSFYTIIDSAVNVNEDFTLSFLEMLKKSGIPISYQANLRGRRPNKRLVQLLGQTGCKEIAIGIESGDDTLLRSMNKVQDLSILTRLINCINVNNIQLMLFLILGFPTEGLKSIQNTIKFLQSIRKRSKIDIVELEMYNPGHIQKLGPHLFKKYGISWTRPNDLEGLKECSRFCVEPGLFGQVQYARGMNRFEISSAITMYQDFFSSSGIEYQVCKPLEI